MKQFVSLVQEILDDGEWVENRTDEPTKALFGKYLEFDLRQGFPAVTVKQLPFKPVIAELVGFMRGYSNVKDFQALGTKVWDLNAEAPYWLSNPSNRGHGDLGRIYGVQWRDFKDMRFVSAEPSNHFAIVDKMQEQGYRCVDFVDSADHGPGRVMERGIDQLSRLVQGLRTDPYGRRHIVTAWNPAELDQMALPPCHVLFQCKPSPSGYLDMVMFQRSCDVFLGLPFNIASYAALLTYLGALTGLKPRKLGILIGDAHLYKNQITAAQELVLRTPLDLPTLRIELDDPLAASVDDVTTDQFVLENYLSHPPLRVPMVV